MFGKKKPPAKADEFSAKLPFSAAFIPPGMTAKKHAGGVKISGGDPSAPSASRTGGYSIRLPDSFERAASGNTVRISITASPIKGRAKLAAAYSTNEVGNSGWREFDVTQKHQVLVFDYVVAPMIDGRGDFIGLLPLTPVVVHLLRADVIARA